MSKKNPMELAEEEIARAKLWQALAELPDDYTVDTDTASLLIKLAVSTLEKSRMEANSKPPWHRVGKNTAAYPLGGLRKYRAGTPVASTATPRITGARLITLESLNLIATPEFYFWRQRTEPQAILGPVFGPSAPDFLTTLENPNFGLVALTQRDACLSRWVRQEDFAVYFDALAGDDDSLGSFKLLLLEPVAKSHGVRVHQKD